MATDGGELPAAEVAAGADEAVELPAPEGWKKKFTPKKSGTTRRNEVIFISPTGEEIMNKKDLGQYLKAHTGGPPLSDFDWGTTWKLDETPRRSVRLSEKAKAVVTPEIEKPPKRERKSGSKKDVESKLVAEGGEDSKKDEPAVENVGDVKEANGAEDIKTDDANAPAEGANESANNDNADHTVPSENADKGESKIYNEAPATIESSISSVDGPKEA